MKLPIWMNPGVIMAFWFGVAVVSLFVPSDMYVIMMGSPKYIRDEHVYIAGGAMLVFSFGALMGILSVSGHIASQEETIEKLRTVLLSLYFRQMCLFFFGLTFIAYAIFLGPTLNAEVLLRFVTGNGYTHGKDWANPISGVTTATQFGVALCALSGYALAVLPPGPARAFYRYMLVALLVFAFYRSFIWSERLATVECMVPAVTAYIIARYKGQFLYKILPLFGLVAVVFFFGVTEYYRSWSFYSQFDISLPAFATTRYLSYYLSSFNNMAVSIDFFEPAGLPVSTLQVIFKIPGMTDLQELHSANWENFMFQFERYTNPEFNLFSGAGVPINDMGVTIGLAIQFVPGFLTGRIYRLARMGRIWGLFFLPCWMTGMAEFGRLMYWGNSRALPIWVLLFVAVYFALQILDREARQKAEIKRASGDAQPAE